MATAEHGRLSRLSRLICCEQYNSGRGRMWREGEESVDA